MPDMMVVQFGAFGGVENLTVATARRPVPGPGDVLVRQVASSINPVDLMIRRGGYPAVPPEKLPYVGGRDVAGHVVEVGEGVDPAWIGRAVFGAPDFDRGAFAEYIVMRPDELAQVPSSLPLHEAALLPIAALTAWQGLFRHGALQDGETVLIHGGSGGVGHYAVQMAANAGARVIATASDRNRTFLQELGADQVLAYDTQSFDETLTGIDLVLDLVGGATQQRSWAVLRDGGRMISAVAEPDAQAAALRKASVAKFFIAQSRPDDLARIAGDVADGRLRSHVAQWYPLAQVAKAQAALETGGIRGKLGIEIGEPTNP